MIDPFAPFLERSGVVILDGALATELERRGADLRDPLWSAKLLIDQPELIRQVHRDYFVAGADVVTSATYQATFEEFARRGLSRAQARELLHLSVRLGQEAREEYRRTSAARTTRPLVAASIGCYGASRHDGSEYRGDYGLSVAELIAFHRPRLDVLARSGADVLACETIPCLAEAEALARLLADYADIPAWLSFSCRDERHVCHGETLAECVATAERAANVVAVGVNCTAPRFVPGLLRSVAGRTAKHLLAYPNSGETWDQACFCWRAGVEAVRDWGAAAQEWDDAGARLIGGCCRTTPAIIREMASVLKRRGV